MSLLALREHLHFSCISGCRHRWEDESAKLAQSFHIDAEVNSTVEEVLNRAKALFDAGSQPKKGDYKKVMFFVHAHMSLLALHRPRRGRASSRRTAARLLRERASRWPPMTLTGRRRSALELVQRELATSAENKSI